MPRGRLSAMPPAPVATPPCGTVLPALEAEPLDWAGAICVDRRRRRRRRRCPRERGCGAEREGGRRGGEDGQDAVLLEEHRNPFLVGRGARPAAGAFPIVREDPSPDNVDSGSAERGSRSATGGGGGGAPRRYVRTASTRRCSVGVGPRPSLWKIRVTCFSTAASVTTSSSAMPLFDFPSAIAASTSRSRGVSSSSGPWLRFRPSIRPTTAGSRALPPAATRATASTNTSTSPTRSLSR